MNSLFRSFILLLTLGTLALSSGCSTLFGRQLSEEEELAQTDPVASVALKLRRPASQSRPLAEHSGSVGFVKSREDSLPDSSPDVKKGMTTAEVRSLWGEPLNVDRAGSGEERWIYYEGLSSRWSLSAARVIYFENGRVAGWELEKP